MEWIWKLIELLNEYEPYIQSDGTHTDNFWWYVSQWHSAVFPKEVWVERIISKSYGFIKWLVEKDKIDKDNEDLCSLMSELWEWKQYEKCLLMLLAIQSEPLNFLISILK